MKLDRNTNNDGSGKYALLKIRNLNKLRAAINGKLPDDVSAAVGILNQRGLIHWGSEGPGEQFFVMKYKDLFSAKALFAYAAQAGQTALKIAQQVVEMDAGIEESGACSADQKGKREQMIKQYRSLMQYCDEMHAEAVLAEKEGNRIPD